MLIDVATGRPITKVPYRGEFDALRGRLTDGEFAAIVARVNELIDETGGEIATAGWLPGADWTGSPFEPIYTKAARGDFDRSALFFGQLVWYAVVGSMSACAHAARRVLPTRSAFSRTATRPSVIFEPRPISGYLPTRWPW